MGDKVNAKKTAIECGLPVVPGSDGELKSLEHALDVAEQIGYPVMLKAAAGGGGRGMRPVMNVSEIAEAYQLTKNESKSAFGDDTLYMEKDTQHRLEPSRRGSRKWAEAEVGQSTPCPPTPSASSRSWEETTRARG